MLKTEKKYISHFPKKNTFKENEISNNPEEKLIKNKKWHTILNPNNCLITKKNIQDILKKGNINIEINDINIWQQAFVHKSYVSKIDNNIEDDNINGIKNLSLNSMVQLQQNSNERLEWLGDAKLQGSVSYYLWERYPDQDEGFLTKLRSKLVKTKNLSYLAKKIGLPPFLLISHHVEFGCQGRTNPRILENTFEAFIGSMFIDFSKKVNPAYGYEVVRHFIISIIEKYVDMVELLIKDENSKDQLMWYFQKNFNGSYPIYLKEKYENECFYIYVMEPNTENIVGRGHARSKKQAEQNTAKNALSYYATKDILKKNNL